MFRILLLLPVAWLGACATNPAGDAKACFNRDSGIESEIGYCQALRSGDRLYISGTVGEGLMPDAIRMAYDGLKESLEAHGLDFKDVVTERVYTTDLDAFIRHKEIRKRYYSKDFPASTWVQVERLYLPSFVVEVELIAEFPR